MMTHVDETLGPRLQGLRVKSWEPFIRFEFGAALSRVYVGPAWEYLVRVFGGGLGRPSLK